jgi:hypothetical protein
LVYLYIEPNLEDRRTLEIQQHQLSEERISSATNIIGVVFTELLKLVPESLFNKEKSTLTVPLHTVVKEFRCVVSGIIQALTQSKYGDNTTFPSLSYQLSKNIYALSGMDIANPGNKKLVLPHDYAGDPIDFLANTPFESFFNVQVPFIIPRNLWPQHAFFLGPSGWGKSQLLGSILREGVEDPTPRTIIVLDPHSQKDNSLFQLAKERMPPERLVVIDPDTNPPDIGLLDYGVTSQHDALDTFKFLMASLAGGLSPKQETSLPSLFELLSKIPNASLVTLHDIITEKPKKGQQLEYASAIAQLDDVHRDFFENLFYTGNYQETKDALQWKMLAALGRPTFKKMFSATKNSIDMDAYLREPKIVLVSGAENALGKDGMRIFILFLIGQYYAAAKRRKSRHLAMCIVDEAWMVLQSTLIADILVELRGFNCSLVCATQIWNQIAEPVRPAVLGSTAIKGVGALQHNDAVVLGRDMYSNPDQIRDLRPYAGQGTSAQWLFHILGMKQPQVVSVPYGILEAMPKFERQTGAAVGQPEVSATMLVGDFSLVSEQKAPHVVEAPTAKHSAASTPPPRSDLDANNRIDKALRLLTPSLRILVETELRRLYKEQWRQHVSVADGSDPNTPLDPYALLKTMLDNWQSCFKDKFKNKTRVDASKAFDARNAFAHSPDEIPAAEAISFLVAIRDIAIAISADTVVDTIKTFIEDQLASGATTTLPTSRPDRPLLKPGKDW